MKLSTIMKDLRDFGLKPHQAEFVQDVVRAPLPVRKLLVAGPGFGKTHAAVFAASEIMKVSPDCRILVIGPRALTVMYEHQFAQALPGMKATVVDRRKLREMEATVKQDQPIWPSAITVVIGMDTARQKDVLTHLCSVRWDLVIVEEVHLYGRSRWTLLKTILSNKTFQRVLMMTATPNLRSMASLLKGVTVTEWVAAELNDWDGRRLFPTNATKFSTVVYQRSDAESALETTLLQLTRELAPSPIGKMIKRVLLKQASSSPLALERTIKRLRNTLTHASSEFLSMPRKGDHENVTVYLEFDADEGLPTTVSRTIWKNKSTALASLNELITLTESLPTDKKREALESLVHRLHQDGPELHQVCIFCSARATASYLQATLAERWGNLWLVTGDQTSEEIHDSLEGFRRKGGLLVCTSIALTGLDLRGVKTFIHYDPAANDSEMRARVTRSPEATHYLLKAESSILSDDAPAVHGHTRP